MTKTWKFSSKDTSTVLESNVLKLLVNDLKLIFYIDEEINLKELQACGHTDVTVVDRRGHRISGQITSEVSSM